MLQYAGGSATSASDAPFHHRWSLKFLHAESALYPLCLRFLHGEALNTLPELEQAVAPFRFIILIEASAERNHHVAGQGIALRHHHTEPFFSLVLRLPHIDHAMQADSSFVIRLAEACDHVRDPKRLACRFALLGHPKVIAALLTGIEDREFMRILRPIVYRCDVGTQYQGLSTFAKEIRDRNEAVTAPRILDAIPTLTDVEAVVLQAMATRHFHGLVGEGSRQSQKQMHLARGGNPSPNKFCLVDLVSTKDLKLAGRCFLTFLLFGSICFRMGFKFRSTAF